MGQLLLLSRLHWMSLSSRESDRVAVWALNRKALQTEINAHQRANEESITRVDRLGLGKTFMLISSNPPLKRLFVVFLPTVLLRVLLVVC